MPEPISEDQKNKLVTTVNETYAATLRSEKLYNNFRLITSVAKIIAALLTSVSAVITGITKQINAAVVTAVAGVLTTVIEVSTGQFQFEKMRSHYHIFQIKYRELLDNIIFKPPLNEELLERYLTEFHKIEEQEVKERPSLHQQK